MEIIFWMDCLDRKNFYLEGFRIGFFKLWIGFYFGNSKLELHN